MSEIIGGIASVLIVISFFMNGEKFVRAANMVGSAVFIVYGLMISSISIVFLNAMSIVVNTVKIYKIHKEEISK